MKKFNPMKQFIFSFVRRKTQCFFLKVDERLCYRELVYKQAVYIYYLTYYFITINYIFKNKELYQTKYNLIIYE
jgi:hypothetical protein